MRFKDFAELKNYLQAIDAENHATRGRWTAAQIFFHLSAAFNGSLEGLPPGFNVVVRKFLRPFRFLVTNILFPPFLPIPSSVAHKLEPPANLDFEDERRRLLEAIRRFEEHEGPLPPHPVLGMLTETEAEGFHLRHCEHHLSFLRLEKPT